MNQLKIMLAIFFVMSQAIIAQKVDIQFNKDHVQASYAARKLSETLVKLNYQLDKGSSPMDYTIILRLDDQSLGKEAYAISSEATTITVSGGDPRGLIYGTLALSEMLQNGTSLNAVTALKESPNLEFRGIKYNLPWETYRPSSALTQHIDTAKDVSYWEAFLDMMVSNRFNVVSLWNMHPYTFMIQPTNFPKASPWSDAEFAAWQHLYREIFRMAKERALDTYIVHWSIFVSKEFADNYDAAKVNYYPHYYVPGDTSKIVKTYLKESVKQVLEEYPDLDGIGISHGEGMAGMTPFGATKMDG